MREKPRVTDTVIAFTLAVIFALTGAAKLLGLEMMADQFTAWGYPTWFSYFVGASEVAAAGLLVAYRTRRMGAFVVGIVTVGAIATHVRVGEFPMTAGPFILLIAALWLLRRRPAPTQEPHHTTKRPERNDPPSPNHIRNPCLRDAGRVSIVRWHTRALSSSCRRPIRAASGLSN